MTENELRVLARPFRVRAAEVMSMAEITEDADAQEALREVVARYLLLAQRLDDSVRDGRRHVSYVRTPI